MPVAEIFVACNNFITAILNFKKNYSNNKLKNEEGISCNHQK